MPATVVIFSCHILRFSINLKYSASTEKSPQPGHHVGWSAAISFLVSHLRSSVAGNVDAATKVMLPVCPGVSVKVWLITNGGLNFAQSGGDVFLGAFENILHLPRQAIGFVDAV